MYFTSISSVEINKINAINRKNKQLKDNPSLKNTKKKDPNIIAEPGSGWRIINKNGIKIKIRPVNNDLVFFMSVLKSLRCLDIASAVPILASSDG